MSEEQISRNDDKDEDVVKESDEVEDEAVGDNGDSDYKSEQGSDVDDDANDIFEAQTKKTKKSSKTKKSIEGTESAKKRRRKSDGKASKRSRNAFFLDEAAEAEEDEEDEEEAAELGAQEMTMEQLAAQQRVEARHQRNAADTRTAEEKALYYEQLAREQRKIDKITLEAARSARSNKFIKPASLPDYNDPRIYRLRCKPGQEDIAIRSILLKSYAMQRQDGHFKVKSAFCGNMKGYIYVEAAADIYVSEIVSTLRMIYSNSIQQVPMKEMTHVLEVTATNKPVEVSQFVRLRRGPNKGDLARVVAVLEGGNSLVIQVVPRIDYESKKSEHGKSRGMEISTQSKVRPSQALFDVEKARASGSDYLRRASHPELPEIYCDVWGNDYYKDGYLLKTVTTSVWVNANDVKPSIEELKIFQSNELHFADTQTGDDYMDNGSVVPGMERQSLLQSSLESQMATLAAKKAEVSPFVPGDLVIVESGELQNLVAKIVSVDDKAKTAKLLPVDKVFQGTTEVELSLLMKHIVPGAHVKVMSGEFAGQTGHVLTVSSGGRNATAAILTDGINTEIQCNISQLQMSDDIVIGHGNLAGYELYDLVSLNDNESAVIVVVGAQRLRVVNHLGVVKDVSPQEIKFKQNSQSMRASVSDGTKTRVVCGDIVKVVSGKHQGRTGTVKHISKGILWLHNNNYPQNSGIFVARGHECSLVGGAGPNSGVVSANSGAFGAALNAAKSGMHSNSSTPMSFAGRTPVGSVVSGNTILRVGSTVKVVKGEYRSLQGVITNIDGDFLQVELSARFKKVYLKKDDVKPIERIAQPAPHLMMHSYLHNNEAFPGANGGAMTPMVGAQTPSWLGSSTPSHLGSETPSLLGSETPFLGGMSGRADDPWRIRANEHDADRLETPGMTPSWTPMSSDDQRRPPTSLTVTPSMTMSTPVMSATNTVSELDLIENMIVSIKVAPHMGKLAVIVEANPNLETIKVRLRNGSGQISEEVIEVPKSGIKTIDPPKQSIVKVVSGPHAGKIGVVLRSAGKDYFLSVDEEKITVKSTQLVWLHSLPA